MAGTDALRAAIVLRAHREATVGARIRVVATVEATRRVVGSTAAAGGMVVVAGGTTASRGSQKSRRVEGFNEFKKLKSPL